MPRRESRQETEAFPVLPPDLQLSFWSQLQAVRETRLGPALERTVAGMATREIDAELDALVATPRLARLSSLGIRGEVFLPVPCILRARPCLLGYYRLLYGFSQKEFYGKGRFREFSAMEKRDALTKGTDALLPALCRSLVETGQLLLDGLARPSRESVHELQLLTIGGQLRGRYNNVIGQEAIAEVRRVFDELVGPYDPESAAKLIRFRNDLGLTIEIRFGRDPDVAVREISPRRTPILCIEVKGGRDASNQGQRIPAAEASHARARDQGFPEVWTLLRTRVEDSHFGAKAATTTPSFNLDDVQDAKHPDYTTFRELLRRKLGIRSPACGKRPRRER